MNAHKPLLECQHISFCYDTQKVLDNVSFSVNCGDFLAIIGPNGGGKSTLCKIIVGLSTATEGSILYDGKKSFNPQFLGYVPQETTHNKNFLIEVLDVVLMGFLRPHIFGNSLAAYKKEAMEILNELGIAHLSHKKIGDLSGGQRQRVLIARAIVSKPRLLILDEPTAHIDKQTQKEIYLYLQNYAKNAAVMIVSHDSSVLDFTNKTLYIQVQATLIQETDSAMTDR
ncbi:hypothetical protein CCZ01_04455 [Helicobacter monodelphidis]|uniref:metal ABC transporter ATP-binding protein n=1 Tax=Helicobacter sp. 15-1451 TaxID=2004995 RepID=UPI000DCD627E|nr:ATP-binding cassette domain-containing protein [Helicobacter sp. 15-1451]RAX57885.1 hypothetical protein CCZ01_04455 [Helicobacter sp. 15-1451]